MMTCEYGSIRDYADCTYEELIELRTKVLDDIVSFEEANLQENWDRKLGSDYEYILNLEFLSNLIKEIKRKFQAENSELLGAISTGAFKVDQNEGRVSQIKRYTRHKRETNASLNEASFVDFSVSDQGNVEAYIAGEHAGTVTDVDSLDEYAINEMDQSINVNMLIKAECHNQKFLGPGSLVRTEWEVYRDGKYRIRKTYNLNWDELERTSSEESDNVRETITSGEMDDNQFRRLCHAVDSDVWRNTSIKSRNRKNNKWQIVMYDVSGHIIKTSGELESIEGNKYLEEIVACLPQEKKW